MKDTYISIVKKAHQTLFVIGKVTFVLNILEGNNSLIGKLTCPLYFKSSTRDGFLANKFALFSFNYFTKYRGN